MFVNLLGINCVSNKIIPLPGVWERDFEKVGGRVTGKYPYRI
jgi:hypothetical protein